MTLWQQFFAWPAGAIWGNVVAEPIVAALALAVSGRWLRRLWRRHEQQSQVRHDALHQKLAELHDKIDRL